MLLGSFTLFDRSKAVLQPSPYHLSVVCIRASFLSFDIPIHLLSFCHDAVWLTVCFLCGISCMVQTLILKLATTCNKPV